MPVMPPSTFLPPDTTNNSLSLVTRMLSASPNAAHEALARFALPHLRHALAPHDSFTLITQNIDGLDRRAIDRAYSEAGMQSPLDTITKGPSGPSPTDQIEPLLFGMHGHVAGVLCTDYECKRRALDLTTPLCPALAGTELVVDARTAPLPPQPQPQPQPKRSAAEARAWAAARLAGKADVDDEEGEPEPELAVSDLPRCARCGSRRCRTGSRRSCAS